MPVPWHRHRQADPLPTVVVDGVHIVYRVYGAGGGTAARSPASSASLTRTRAPSIREVHAIKGVSFAAYEGEAIGLIGSNGSGKSTLLRAIAGLLPPNEGSRLHPGPAVAARRERGADGRPVRRAQRDARLPGHGHDPGADPERSRAIIEFSGINERGDFASLPMRTYSSGMGARLRFAIASAKTHDVLLIDEALATGDAKFRRRSEDRIREMRDAAGTVFLVSHCDRHDRRHLRTHDLARIGSDPRGRPDGRGRGAVRGLQQVLTRPPAVPAGPLGCCT